MADENKAEIEIDDVMITSLAATTLRTTVHAASMMSDGHRNSTSRDFLLTAMLIAGYNLHRKLTGVCECEDCQKEVTDLAGAIAGRAIALLDAQPDEPRGRK